MKLFICILLVFAFFACESEQEIIVDLPEFEEQLVVECYLEDGKIPRAFLTQSVGYFENKPLSVNNADFKIISQSRKYQLKNQLKEDDEFPKYYNYIAKDTLHIKYGEILQISVEDELGRKITGSSQVLPTVKIDSVSYTYNNNNGSAFPVIHFYDDPIKKNYYRYTIKKLKEKRLNQDIVFDDYLLNGNSVMGTGTNFKRGDYIIVTLYHIDKKYYEYLNSINGAENANFSAFAQPYPIKSTVDEGIGVFTVLSYDQKKIKLK